MARPVVADRAARRLAWPYTAGLVLLVAWPLLLGIALIFFDPGVTGRGGFAGLDNVRQAFGDPLVWSALGTSAVLLLITTPLRLFLALSLALLLARSRRGVGALRVGAFLPTAMPDIALALVWLWLLNPVSGPVPALLQTVGSPSPSWLTEPWPARVAVATLGAFVLGEALVVALAARRAIPAALYETAQVEGARSSFALRTITLPLLAPVIGLLTLRDVALALQASFVPALVLTEGGPGTATTTYPLVVYRTAFAYGEFGAAGAMGLLALIVAVALVALSWPLLRSLLPSPA